MASASVWPHPCVRIRVIETHISWVILTGRFAYKIKKPVRYSFVDFSTLEARRKSCEDEVRLNRRLAKDIYLDVVPIAGTPRAPRVAEQPAIEYAVRMAQFAPEQTLDEILKRGEAIDVGAIREFARTIAGFHSTLAPVDGPMPEKTAQSNFDALAETIDSTGARSLHPIGAWLKAQCAALARAFRCRERHGFIRECHGDLHLGNLVRIGERIQAFDCIEFNRELRCIDTIDEVAFLSMDLIAHGREDYAFEFLNRYLELTGDYDGVRLLRFYLVHRALVRSYVRVLGERDGNSSACKRYLDLAQRLTRPSDPQLIITNGLSGSGKTYVSDQLIGRLPAVRIRSDILRKQLHGLQPDERSDSDIGEGLYSGSASDATYAELSRVAGIALQAGFTAIVDASFLERARRSEFAELARRHAAPFVVLSVTASEEVLRQRVRRRHEQGADASEAGLDVLNYQLQRAEEITPGESGAVIVVDTGQPVDAVGLARQIAAVVR